MADTVDLTIAAMWENVQAEFRALVGKDLKENADATPEQLVQRLEISYNSKHSEEKRKRIKKICAVLEHIKQLAAVAGAGAEEAFAGARGCFSAVSFLLGIPNRISQVYEHISDMFDQIQGVIWQHRILARVEQVAKLDPSLRENTHAMLTSFVRMVALTYKTLSASTWDKVKVGVKASLGDTDQGYLDELKEFEKLSVKQDRLYNTLNHELGQGTKQVVERMHEMMLNQDAERKAEITKKDVERELFGAEDEKVQKARKDQKARLAALREQRIDGSGTWIATNEYYQKWRDHSGACQPLLMVRGKARSGKSHLIPAILNDLEEGLDFNKLLSAVYIFDKQDFSGKDTGAGEHPALKTALRYMASQIADSSPPYLRELHALLQSKQSRGRFDRSTESLEDLWNQLRFAAGKNENTYVLVFDGLETLPPTAAESLLSLLANPRGTSANASASTATMRLRILATGTSEVFSKRSVGPLVDMSESESADLVKYIDSKIATEPLLKDLRARFPEDAQRFRNKITEDSDGDFGVAKSRLDDIIDKLRSSGTELDDIDAMLSEPPERDSEKLARRTLDDLNLQLKPNNIDQLNEILKWVVYAPHPRTGDRLSIGQVDIIASLSTKRAAAMSFKAKVMDKDMFGRILDLETLNTDSDEFVVVRPELIDLFRSMQEQEQTAATNGAPVAIGQPRISLTIQVENARPEDVRRYLWDLSERISFEPYFFTKPLVGAESTTKIRVSQIESRATILDVCLRLLGEDPKDSTHDLEIWAMKHLPYHIRWAAQNFDQYPDMKSLVLNLISVLTEVDTTVQHWTNLDGIHGAWLDAQTIKAVDYILRRAQRDLSREFRAPEKRLLKKLLEQPGDFAVYTDLTLKLGRHWLLGDSWDVLPSYKWVDAYLEAKVLALAIDQSESWDQDLTYEDWDWDTGSYLEEDSDNDDEGEEPQDTNNMDGQYGEDNASVEEIGNDGNGENDDATLENGQVLKDDQDEENGQDDGGPSVQNDEATSKTTKARIKRAAKWVEATLAITAKDADWYARLGKTFMLKDEFDEALSTFEQVPESERNSNYTIRESKARAFAGKDNLSDAVLEMNEALILLREIHNRTKDQQAGLIDSCRTLAWWYREDEMDALDNAALLYGEVLSLDPEHWETYDDLINVWHDKHDPRDSQSITELFTSMLEKPTGKSLSRLAELFRNQANSRSPYKFFELFFALVQRTDLYSLAFDALDEASHYGDDERKKARFEIASFTVLKGLLIALQDRTPDGLGRAVKLWDEGLQTLEHSDFTDWGITDWTVELVQNYHFQKALLAGPDSKYHAEQLADLTRKQPNDLENLGQNCFLARYYTLTGQEESAKTLLTPIAAEILQNNVWLDSGDWLNLANIYVRLGDNLQALSALSQCGPDSLDVVCDGNCGTKWNRAGDWWHCRACPNTQFCDKCLEKVKEGTLEVHWCHQEHDWLHVPSWPEAKEELATDGVLWGGVQIEGTWNRDGAEVLKPREWLQRIQDDWGVEGGSFELSDDERSDGGNSDMPGDEAQPMPPGSSNPQKELEESAISTSGIDATPQAVPVYSTTDSNGGAYNDPAGAQGWDVNAQGQMTRQYPPAQIPISSYVDAPPSQRHPYADEQQQAPHSVGAASDYNARYAELPQARDIDDDRNPKQSRSTGLVAPDYIMTASAAPVNPYDGDGYGHTPWMDQKEPPQIPAQIPLQPQPRPLPPQAPSTTSGRPQYDSSRAYQSPVFQEQRRASPVSRKPVGRAPSNPVPIIQSPERKAQSPLSQSQFQDSGIRPQSYQSPPPPLPPQSQQQDRAYASASTQWNQRPTSQMPPDNRYRATETWAAGNSLPADAAQVVQGARYYEMPYQTAPYQGSAYQVGGGSSVNEPRWGQGQPAGQSQQSAGQQLGTQRAPQWNQKWSYDSYGS